MSRLALRPLLRALLVLLYVVAGVAHLTAPDGFLAIMPDFVPFSRQVVLLTGVAELAGAAGLLIPRLRWWAGVMLALYAVAVFPANIKHAFAGVTIAGVELNWWYHAPRLALQPVLVGCALYAGGVIDWPFRRHARAERDV
jgi:uncharacterized membrane protein